MFTDDDDPVILLVEAADRLSHRFGDHLEAATFEIHRVGAASECIDFIERVETDAILSQYALPDLTGIQLLRSVRVTQPTLPFLLAPADGSESLASDAIAAGVSRYVSADEDPARITEHLRESLQQPAAWLDAEGGERYQHLVEASPVPINLFDETGESIWCNRAVLDLLGLEARDDLIGESIFEFIHPDDHELAESEIEAVIDQKRSVGPTRMRLRRPDGEIRHVLVSTAVGRFLGADIGQAVVVDVTQLRRTEQALRDERSFIASALDSLDDLFYVLNADGEIVRWNDAVPDVSEYDEEQLRGRPIIDLFAAEDRDRLRASIRTVLETGSDTVEATLVTADDRRIPFEFRGRRVNDAGQGRVVAVGRDMTDRRERERQLFVLERWLRHNIRNDLNVIHGHAEDLRDAVAEEYTDRAAVITDHAERLVRQADYQQRVVDLVANPAQSEPIEVTAVVAECVSECRRRYPTADIEVSSSDGIEVDAVPEIRLAVTELIENAIIHSDDERPAIGVDVDVDGDTCRIRVADDGPGIPDDERTELVIDRDVDQLVHGSGLGLFVVYWAARNSGGDIEFAENEPRGTVVTIRLPLSRGT